jgi:hypothetical protein
MAMARGNHTSTAAERSVLLVPRGVPLTAGYGHLALVDAQVPPEEAPN